MSTQTVTISRRRPAPERDGHATGAALAAMFRPLRMVTLKLTPGCNLRCTYCNVDAAGTRSPQMSLETYRRVIDLLVEHSVHRDLVVELHGGEPLLLGTAWVREAVAYAAERGAATGHTFTHPIATNATMLDDEWADLIAELGLHVKVSLDGPPELSDQLRGGGKATVAGLRRLQARGLSPLVRVVVSPTNAQRMSEVASFLEDEGVRLFSINYLQPQGRGVDDEQLDDDDMLASSIALFEHMAEHGTVFEQGALRMLERFVYGRRHPAPLSCWESQCQAGRTFVGIDHAGRIHACPTDVEHHVLGAVWDEPDPVHVRRTLDRLHVKDAWHARCRGCEAAVICDQSCPTSDYNSTEYREMACAHTKRLHSWLTEHPAIVDTVRTVAEATPVGEVAEATPAR
jgi:radical SAM protein with 4Fe4S-binding SPASM domain